MSEAPVDERTGGSAQTGVGHELRVLGGAHAGARAPLPHAGAMLTVSQGPHTDIVLRDVQVEGGSATITLSPHGWTWLQAGAAEPTAFKFGATLSAGPVLLTVDASDAPWPAGAALPLPLAAPGPCDAADAEAAASHDAADAATPAGSDAATVPGDAAAVQGEHLVAGAPPDAAAPHAAAAPPQAPARRRRWPLTTAAACLGIAATTGLVAAVVPMIAPAAPVAPAVPASPAVRLPDPSALLEDIASLGLSDSVRAMVRETDVVDVLGVVRDDEQHEALAVLLLRHHPRPRLRLLTQAEFEAQARGASAGLDAGMMLEPLERGRLRLHGVAADRAHIAAALERIAKELPMAAGTDLAVVLPEEAVAAFGAELWAAGLASLRARWDGGHMQVDGALPGARVPDWERLVLAFHRRYGAQVRFMARLSVLQGEGPHARARPHLSVAAVVSGRAPYVVLADGRKVMPGGRVSGYRLDEVRADALVLTGGDGHAWEVPR